MDLIPEIPLLGSFSPQAVRVCDSALTNATLQVANEVALTRKEIQTAAEHTAESIAEQTYELSSVISAQTQALLAGLDTMHSDLVVAAQISQQHLSATFKLTAVQEQSLEVLRTPMATRSRELLRMAQSCVARSLPDDARVLLSDAVAADPTCREAWIATYRMARPGETEVLHSALTRAMALSETWLSRAEVLADACDLLFELPELEHLLKRADAEYHILDDIPSFHLPTAQVMLNVARLNWRDNHTELAREAALAAVLQDIECLALGKICTDRAFIEWVMPAVEKEYITEMSRKLTSAAKQVLELQHNLEAIGIQERMIVGVTQAKHRIRDFASRNDPVYLQAALRLMDKLLSLLDTSYQSFQRRLLQLTQVIRQRSMFSEISNWEGVQAWCAHYLEVLDQLPYIADSEHRQLSTELNYYRKKVAIVKSEIAEQTAPFAICASFEHFLQQQWLGELHELGEMLQQASFVNLDEIAECEERCFRAGLSYVAALVRAFTTKREVSARPQSSCASVIFTLGLLIIAIFNWLLRMPV